MESDDPKALSVLRGKPFLKHILDTLDQLELPIKPIIVVGYQKEKIFDTFGNDMNYVLQEEQLGTGHALMQAQNKTHKDHDIVIVLSIDQPMISKKTIQNIIDTHKKTKAIITIGTVVLPDFNEWRRGLINFGRIMRDTNNKVIKIIEYKDATLSEKKIKEINPAIYAFDSIWLWDNINRLKNINAQNEYYLTDLLDIASKDNLKIETVLVSNIIEAFQPNTKEELEILEGILDNTDL